MTRDFLGTGWRSPVSADDRGDVATSSGEEGIEQAVRIILGTAKGERVMRPEFGCDVHDHVFSAINPTTLNMIESAVEEALTRWEPRIDLDAVEARQDDQDSNRVLIEISYWIRSTNSLSNVVYPFYVDEGER